MYATAFCGCPRPGLILVLEIMKLSAHFLDDSRQTISHAVIIVNIGLFMLETVGTTYLIEKYLTFSFPEQLAF